jgi:hypothetical protein
MAPAQADLKRPSTKSEDMPSFDESKNVSDDVRGKQLCKTSIEASMLIVLS